jgi:hypothetical protein
MGRILILIGVVLITIGIVVTYAPGLLQWFGRLPGDIRIERERGTFLLPITSMVVISLVLTVVLNLLFRR